MLDAPARSAVKQLSTQLPRNGHLRRPCGRRRRVELTRNSKAIGQKTRAHPGLFLSAGTTTRRWFLVSATFGRPSLLHSKNSPCSGGRLRRRTPGPPPFSSMNSTPADSSARRTAKLLAAVIEVSPSVSSARRIVATLRAVSRARSSALHRMSARAALIWALVSSLAALLTCLGSYAIIHSICY